ncbi:MAG: hypothetical protein A2Y07_04465 [Planctomycetes bacterium GWF2_50_10]|nr:MAG: hypothetical protein A2Y07_04465 [Planctomycetes bacterium GWF2_50_10]
MGRFGRLRKESAWARVLAHPTGFGRLNKFLWGVVILMLAAGIFCKYRYKHNRLAIYDLTWQTNDSNGQIDHRWRYFIDPQTHLPRKIEKYNKTNPATDYILKETLLITYPSDDEIERFVTIHKPL